MNPTKFNCWTCRKDMGVPASKLLGHILVSYQEMVTDRGITVPIVMPVHAVYKDYTEIENEGKLFSEKKIERQRFILVFDRELTEIELNYWRMFVLGHFTKQDCK